jgi:hypothetical protein
MLAFVEAFWVMGVVFLLLLPLLPLLEYSKRPRSGTAPEFNGGGSPRTPEAERKALPQDAGEGSSHLALH